MKISIKSVLTAVGVSLFGFTASANADNYSLLSAPFGTGSYVISAALEQVISNNNSTIRVSHSESPGFAFNHNQLERDASLRTTMLVGSGRGVNNAAKMGTTPFDKPVATVLAIANYNLVSAWLVTLDANIKTIADLEGKSIALGRRPQINWTIQPEALLREGWGLNNVRIQYLGPQEAVGALLDGQVDAAVVGGYFDPSEGSVQLAPQTIEFLASGRTAHFLDWGVEAVEKVNAGGMPMVLVDVPAAILPGRDTPLKSFADTASWTAHADFPEEAAYEITKLIIENVGSFANYHSLGSLMTRESLPFGWEIDELHPGALRAYREAGILD